MNQTLSMSPENPDNQSAATSPLIWGIIAVIVLVMVFVFFSGRSGTKTEKISLDTKEKAPNFAGEIARQEPIEPVLVAPAPPAPGARELIRLARENQRPYPLDTLFDQALLERADKDLENAHLLFFFCAREGHLPSILMMGEMADPLLFNEEKSLLDQADPIQAYKWYKIAIERNNVEAQEKMNALQQWAEDEANTGNKIAQQLLLSFVK